MKCKGFRVWRWFINYAWFEWNQDWTICSQRWGVWIDRASPPFFTDRDRILFAITTTREYR